MGRAKIDEEIMKKLRYVATLENEDSPDPALLKKLDRAYRKNPSRVEGILEEAVSPPISEEDAEDSHYIFTATDARRRILKPKWSRRKKAVVGAIAGLALLVTNQDFFDKVGIGAQNAAYSGMPTWNIDVSAGGRSNYGGYLDAELTVGGRFISGRIWGDSELNFRVVGINGHYTLFSDHPSIPLTKMPWVDSAWDKNFKLGKK